jgi:hypothetical protein
MAISYDPKSWYWIVGNKAAPNNIFSARAAAYVGSSDPGYQEFLESGNRATVIDLDGHLADVLVKAGCPAALVIAAGWSELSACGTALMPADVLAVMLAGGCRIGSTGAPGLNATYGIEPSDEDNYLGLQAGITATPAAPWIGYIRDVNGAKVMMTAAQATAVMTGILGYIEAVSGAVAAWASGSAWVPPAQPVTIA